MSKPTKEEAFEQLMHEREKTELDEFATYRQLFVDCRKPKCKRCRNGPAHGPYWYKELKHGRGSGELTGRVTTKYIGRRLPPAIAAWVARIGQPEAQAAAQAQIAEDELLAELEPAPASSPAKKNRPRKRTPASSSRS